MYIQLVQGTRKSISLKSKKVKFYFLQYHKCMSKNINKSNYYRLSFKTKDSQNRSYKNHGVFTYFPIYMCAV